MSTKTYFLNKVGHNKSFSVKAIPLAYSGHSDWTRTMKGTKFPVCKRKVKFDEIIQDTPGPGSYDTNLNKIGHHGPFLSIKPKIEISDHKKAIPGPGSYYGNNFNMGKTMSSVMLSTSSLQVLENRHKTDLQKFMNKKPAPNPWSYSPNIDMVRKKSKICKIGKSPKSEFLKEVSERHFEPSPDSYDINSLK